MKIKIFVMPAWIAGIQVCKDASGNIHVNLDSSAPCWNDAIEGFCLKLIEAPPPRIFEGAHEEHEGRKHFFFGFDVLSVIRSSCPSRPSW
jgi:hypothetical protein